MSRFDLTLRSPIDTNARLPARAAFAEQRASPVGALVCPPAADEFTYTSCSPSSLARHLDNRLDTRWYGCSARLEMRRPVHRSDHHEAIKKLITRDGNER